MAAGGSIHPKSLRAARNIFVDCAALHHEHNAPDSGDVAQRIAIERDDVRLHAGRAGFLLFSAEDEHLRFFCRERRPAYFFFPMLRIILRISGQNSLTTLLRAADSIPVDQFSSVLWKPRSSGG
jgi:hypothetical protein